MYTEQYSLPFLAGVLIAAMERRRPGLAANPAGMRAELRVAFDSELVELRRRFFELFDDKPYWERVERTLADTCFPRYLALAEKQAELEKADYGLWRGGDLVARGSYAAAGLVIGILMVKIPFIPIPQTWDAFALFTMVGGPFLPDLQVSLHKRRHRRALAAIVKDMKEAEDHQRMYQPLSDLAGPRLAATAVDPLATDPSPTASTASTSTRNGGGHG